MNMLNKLNWGHQYISAKIEFSNKAAKQDFNKFNIKGPAFQASAEFSKASESFKSSASISIQAYQQGGDVTRLSAIFGGDENLINENGKNTHALLVCSMSNPGPCLQILTSAIQYATDTTDQSAFPNQIKPETPLDDPRGPAELTYITSPWSDLGLLPPPAIITEGIKAAREELSFEFEKNFAFRNRVRALQSGPMRLSNRQRSNIEEIDQAIAFNLNKIQETAFICYTNLDQCVEAVVNLKQTLKEIDEDKLDIFPETIAQWYDIKDEPKTRKSIKYTLDTLTDKVKHIVNDFDGVEDKAAVVEKLLSNDLKELKYSEINFDDSIDLDFICLLSNLEELDLYNANIFDINPLQRLKKLVTLILTDNKIKDISSLKGLENLVKLRLEANQIVDISPLQGLNNLVELNLSSNQIVDISSLKVLNTLALDSNQIVDISSLKGLNNLILLFITSNQVVDISPLQGLKNLVHISLRANQIVDINSLKELNQLETLNLEQNKIKDISLLGSLTKLTTLQLYGNPIDSKVCPVTESEGNQICYFDPIPPIN